MSLQVEPMDTKRLSLPAPHASSIQDVVRELGTDPERGLSEAEAQARLGRWGANRLAEAPTRPWWVRLARQFSNLVIWILIFAAVVSGLLGDWFDAAIILAIVVLNGVLGFIQEERAERALALLRGMAIPHARTVRDGQHLVLPVRQLVPGDRVDLEAGDHVPADLRLLASAGFRVQEAALTGESIPVDKDHRPALPPTTPLADRVNIAHMGTSVTAGSAAGIVVATAMQTEIGRIASLLQAQEAEPTPLQRRLEELGRTLIWIVLGIVSLIFLLQLLRGGALLNVFLLSVSLAVAAVPEGLPAVVTISLALGLQRMARRNALIRRLPSVETLGAVTVICSDKTGTLTRNEMTVREIYAGGERFHVDGSGYAPEGSFRRQPGVAAGSSGEAIEPKQEPDLLQTLVTGAWCNHAYVSRDELGQWLLVGDPTEGALVVAARKAGIEMADREAALTHEIPFDSDRKAMSVVALQDGLYVMYTKGAPEVVLTKCDRIQMGGAPRPLTEADGRRIMEAAHSMGEQGLRVLAMAFRPDVEPQEEDEARLIFAGMAGMMDPPREEARAAVERCRTAGIRPVMITGDHPDTARAIAIGLGISEAAQPVVIGSELDQMSQAQLAAQVGRTNVYGRVTAEHKLRIVNALRDQHDVVAMTGDGVNDAPSVKAADIGIAMGITGTDVTKEASDMVLTDDNFASIVNAVEEGRTIYDNIRKFVHYLLATNAGEVILMFVAALMGWPAPLFAIQILWINLVTDALPALALAVEQPEPDIMSRPPRPPRDRVISRTRGLLILYHGLLIAAVSTIAFLVISGPGNARLPEARTAAFCTIAYAQLVFAFACRSHRYTLPQLGAFTNRWLLLAILTSTLLQTAVVLVPFLQPLFKTVPAFSAWEWAMIALLALTPVTFVEVAKLIHAALPGRRHRLATE